MKSAALIVAAEGNNLCRREGLEGEIQPLFRELMGAVDDTTSKTSLKVLSTSFHALSVLTLPLAKLTTINQLITIMDLYVGPRF